MNLLNSARRRAEEAMDIASNIANRAESLLEDGFRARCRVVRPRACAWIVAAACASSIGSCLVAPGVVRPTDRWTGIDRKDNSFS